TVAVNLEALAHAIGINRVKVVDPFDIEETRRVIDEELKVEEPSLIISRRPCALLKNVKHKPAMVVERDACTGCKACLQVGCPAIMQTKAENGKTKAFIDSNQCLGCEVCAASCRFNAIRKGGN
ncbi:MAG TPA: indolepyruvate ferredoxin oxidoreductase subunit alpha, partial [Clostridiales bacterium]|nr:indolepyruvate ferredoxin oxidoreductase subunit alpha [Clostridiales bacterium]